MEQNLRESQLCAITNRNLEKKKEKEVDEVLRVLLSRHTKIAHEEDEWGIPVETSTVKFEREKI